MEHVFIRGGHAPITRGGPQRPQKVRDPYQRFDLERDQIRHGNTRRERRIFPWVKSSYFSCVRDTKVVGGQGQAIWRIKVASESRGKSFGLQGKGPRKPGSGGEAPARNYKQFLLRIASFSSHSAYICLD